MNPKAASSLPGLFIQATVRIPVIMYDGGGGGGGGGIPPLRLCNSHTHTHPDKPAIAL